MISGNGLDALAIMRDQNPAMIITTPLMRPVTGDQLIAILRSAYRDRCPPIVLLASRRLVQTMQASADAVLLPPWELQQLADIVTHLLATAK